MCHERVRLTRNFTVLDNALIQHATLGGAAIAIACYIASQPEGTRVDIRTLADKLHFGRTTVSRALNALEAHGYLRRTVVRTPDGRVRTHTVFCHKPSQDEAPPRKPPHRKPPKPTAPPTPPTPPTPKPAGRRPLPPVPRPGFPARELLRSALHVLLDLRKADPRLYVSEADADHLAPGVAAWLERDAAPETIHHALTANLPQGPLTHPAALLAHRLTTHLPPAPPPLQAHPPLPPPDLIWLCDACDVTFKALTPTCPSCGTADATPSTSPVPRC
ncbi:MarR family transcriptional regulator [Streptomyces sp. NPDC058955]|uniref:MarR family transcriptional regulator n=1 Tax=unclassified Streptomyces TaxID=2593676 RepID=UPI00365BF2E0